MWLVGLVRVVLRLVRDHDGRIEIQVSFELGCTMSVGETLLTESTRYSFSWICFSNGSAFNIDTSTIKLPRDRDLERADNIGMSHAT